MTKVQEPLALYLAPIRVSCLTNLYTWHLDVYTVEIHGQVAWIVVSSIFCRMMLVDQVGHFDISVDMSLVNSLKIGRWKSTVKGTWIKKPAQEPTVRLRVLRWGSRNLAFVCICIIFSAELWKSGRCVGETCNDTADKLLRCAVLLFVRAE